jgi:hypothetical protein
MPLAFSLPPFRMARSQFRTFNNQVTKKRMLDPSSEMDEFSRNGAPLIFATVGNFEQNH